jgi:hypothetical protein
MWLLRMPMRAANLIATSRLFATLMLAAVLLACRGDPSDIAVENRGSEKSSEMVVVAANQSISVWLSEIMKSRSSITGTI